MTRPVLPLLLTLLMVACATTTTVERRAFQTIGTITTTTDAAIGAYDVWLQAHPATPRRDIIQGRRAVQAYTNSLAVARSAVIAYKSGAADKPALDRALDVLAASSTNVVKLVGAIQATTSSPPPVNGLQPLTPR